MTYSSGGLIQPADFNAFTGGGAGSGANVSGQINTVIGTGYGNAGYGQTLVSNVSAGIVSATNWASLVNAVNMARKHQIGASYTNIGVPTSGTIISYLSTLSSTIASAYTNRTTGTSGLTTSGLYSTTLIAAANEATNGGKNLSIQFSSADQFRYFFNAGGTIKLEFYDFTNTLGNGRGTSLQTLAQTNFASKIMLSNSFTARSGTGGTATTDTTTGGFYGLSTTETVYCRINSTSYYSGDAIEYRAYSSGTSGSYGDKGNFVYLTYSLYSGTTGATQDALNINVRFLLTVTFPSTTYLSNSWGGVTVS